MKHLKIIRKKITNYFFLQKNKRIFKEVKLIIWDVDETLYFNHKTINQTRKAYLDEFIGNQNKQSALVKFQQGEADGKRWFEILAEKKHITCRQAIQQIENIIDKSKYIKKNPNLVDFIKTVPITNIILTNSSRKSTTSILKKLGFDSRLTEFSQIITGDELADLKPNLQILAKIARLYNIHPKDIMVIGDSLTDDILPAKSIGMGTCQITTIHQSNEANFSIKTIDDLIAIIKPQYFRNNKIIMRNRIATTLKNNNFTIFYKLLDKNLISNCYLVGGSIRDILLKRDSSDFDFKTPVANTIYAKTITKIGKILSQNFNHVTQANLSENLTLFSWCISTHKYKKIKIDFTIVKSNPLFEKIIPDKKNHVLQANYSINDIFFDIRKNKLYFSAKSKKDINNKIIRLTNLKDFDNQPIQLFRAIYLSSKLKGFSLENNTLKAIIANSHLAINVFNQFTFSQNAPLLNIYAEQIFKGLQYDQHTYFKLMQKTKLASHLKTFIVKNLNLTKMSSNTYLQREPLWLDNYIDNVNLFLKYLLKEYRLDNNNETLTKIRKLFHITP